MPLVVFELCCAAVIALTLAVLARRQGVRSLARDYGALAVAAWAGEQSCISAYHFYRYADGWHLRLLDVPVLVPLIWPLVILSARDVVHALWKSRAAPLLVGAAVVFDASLVEVLSVRAGLWSWAEPGHLGVPLIGMLGWGYFAAAAAWLLQSRSGWSRLALLLVAPLAAHAAIQVSWWGLFRWALRGELGSGSLVALAALSGALTAAVLLARARGRGMTLHTAMPRLAATLLFVVLFLLTAAGDAKLWIHLGCVAVPYLASMHRGVRQAPLRAPSPTAGA
jgi:hypothetical protein